MGCWNGTDMLTGMSIRNGEKIGIILLTPGYKENFYSVYSTDQWQPVHPPIWGEYNDYGGIEDIEDDFWSRNLAQAFGIDPTNKTWEEKLADIINKHIERGEEDEKIFGQIDLEKLSISFCMIYPESFELAKNLQVYNWRISEKQSTYDVSLKWIQERCKELSNFAPSYYPIKAELHDFLLPQFCAPDFPYKFGKDNYVQAHVEMHALNHALTSLRRIWHPTTGCGSQDDNHDEVREYMKQALILIDKKKKEYKETWGDEEEE